ncbi:MAG: O-antigen ligase family protein [Bacteroidia bacterium]|nr:O-antigen ligase family protein [Bacteroidia bacterium]
MEKLSSHINPIVFVVIGSLIGLIPVLGFMLGIPEISVFPLLLIAAWMAFTYPLGFTILIAGLVPLSIQINDIGGGLGLSLPTEPMMIFFFVLLIFRFIIRGNINTTFIKHPIVLFAVLYLTWYFITTLTSSMLFVSVKSFVAKFWFIAIFFFFLAPNLRTPKVMKQILYAMIAGGTVMVLYTLIRHAGEGFVRIHSYTIMRPFFSDHGSYAAFLALFVPILFAFAFYGKRLSIALLWRVVLGVLCVIFLFGILFSFTRATWISIVAMMGFAALVYYKITFKQLMVGVILVISIIVWKQESILYELSRNKQDSAENIEDNMKSVSNISTDPSNMERINRWKCAVAMVKDKPIFGFGPYTYTFQYAPYQRPEDMTRISTNAGTLGNAHSEYFMALSEMGYLGFILVLGLFLSSLYVGMKIYRYATQSWVKTLAMAITLGLFTYYIHGLINNYSEYDKISVPLWSFLAILTALDLFHAQYVKNPENQTYVESGK